MDMKRLLVVGMSVLVVSSACASTPSPIAPTPTPTPVAPTPLRNPTATLTVSPANLLRNQAAMVELSVSGWSLSSSSLDFGDGTPKFKPALGVGADTFTASSAVVQHVYRVAGSFIATLEVTDTAGKTASASAALIVSDQ